MFTTACDRRRTRKTEFFFWETHFESENDFSSLRVFIESGFSKKQPTTAPRDTDFSTRALKIQKIKALVASIMKQPLENFFEYCSKYFGKCFWNIVVGGRG